MNTSSDLISRQERSWRRRRLDPDHSLGLRLTLAATAAFLVLVPFALLALLVLDAWSPLSRLDATITDALHGYALDHPAWVGVMEVWTHVFGPGPLRVAAAGVVVWLLLRGAPRLALWVVTTMAVGWLLGVAVVAATTAAFSTWRTHVGRRPAHTAREGVEPEVADPGPDGRHA